MLKGLFGRVGKLIRGRANVDDELLDELEEALIEADVPVSVAVHLVEEVRERAERDRITDGEGILELLRNIVRRMLTPYEAEMKRAPTPPTVVLMLGVNGVGKTTTIAKLAHHYRKAGDSVLVVAADTFRAAAIEQLTIWAERVGCDIVKQELGSDPGAVVYDGLQAASARGTDVVIIDTAGRLHTKSNLMAELVKITRVIERALGRPADEKLLVLDANTGQNAIAQGRQFHEAVGLTGLVLAKLDSTARGGVAISVVTDLQVPIKLIGTGEKVEALSPFSAVEFADALLEQ